MTKSTYEQYAAIIQRRRALSDEVTGSNAKSIQKLIEDIGLLIQTSENKSDIERALIVLGLEELIIRVNSNTI